MSPALSGPLRDAIVVDWSAAAMPTTGTDSCWLALGALDVEGPIRTENHATRFETMCAIEHHLSRSARRGRRVLVALDVSFGLPRGSAKVLGLPGRPRWRALWRRVSELAVDDERNANNRFAVANELNESAKVRCFWGRPIAPRFEQYRALSVRNVAIDGLTESPLPRLRRTEELAGPGVISNWMLVGKGAVGGQMLTCLPYLERLRNGEAEVRVWPFEGLGDPGGDVVLAETWHGLFDWRAERDALRDQAQVRGTLRALRRAGTRGRVELLTPRSLTSLPTRQRQGVLGEEGWTLGVR